MHGMIMDLVNRFVTETYGKTAWEAVLEDAGLAGKKYHAFMRYHDDEAAAILTAGVKLSHKSKRELLMEFGRFMAPELIDQASILIKPNWKTMDVLLNAEQILQRLMQQVWGVKTPIFYIEKSGFNQVKLSYGSKSKLCSIARGIVEGVAIHFNEKAIAIEEKCMLLGAHECVFNFQVMSAVPVMSRPMQSSQVFAMA